MSPQSISTPSKTAYVETFEQFSPVTGYQVIFAQRYAADNSKIGSPIQVTPDTIPAGEPAVLLLSNGGFLVTFGGYDSNNPTSPSDTGLFDSRLVKPDNTVVSGGISSENSQGDDGTGIVVRGLATVALKSGGYAYALETTNRDFYYDSFDTRTFGLVSATGQIISTILIEQSSHSDEPYPQESAPTIKEVASSNIVVSWTAAYDPSSAGADYYQPGQTTFSEVFDATGRPLTSTFVDFNGASTVSDLNANGLVTASTTRPGDGSSIFQTFDPATFRTLTKHIRYADGARLEANYAVSGQPYSQQIATYDKNGHLLEMTRENQYGGLLFHQINNADGSSLVDNYDFIGRSSTIIATAADRSHDVTTRTYASDSSAKPSTVEIDHYGTNNKLLSANLTNANGSHKQAAFVSGAVLTSTSAVVDTFKSAAVGGDTFVFKPAFGQDIITNFHAGSAAGHDTADLSAFHITLASGQTQADYLAQHLKQVGSDTVVTMTPTDTITLQHTLVASLTKDNVTL